MKTETEVADLLLATFHFDLQNEISLQVLIAFIV